MLICNFCTKECKSIKSHVNHERTCPVNPNRNYKNGMTGKPAWNKGLTKQTSDIISKYAEKLKGSQLGFRKGSKHSIETKERISEIMSEKMQTRYIASKRFYYNGYLLESSWELELAKDLDRNGIKWVRPKPLIYRDDSNQKRRYYPDFYLVDYNVYIDPKNDYVRTKDKKKIQWVVEQNNVKIILLGKNQLSWKICASMM